MKRSFLTASVLALSLLSSSAMAQGWWNNITGGDNTPSAPLAEQPSASTPATSSEGAAPTSPAQSVLETVTPNVEEAVGEPLPEEALQQIKEISSPENMKQMMQAADQLEKSMQANDGQWVDMPIVGKMRSFKQPSAKGGEETVQEMQSPDGTITRTITRTTDDGEQCVRFESGS